MWPIWLKFSSSIITVITAFLNNDFSGQQQSTHILSIYKQEFMHNWLVAEISSCYLSNFGTSRQLEKSMYLYTYGTKWKVLCHINRILSGWCINTFYRYLHGSYFRWIFEQNIILQQDSVQIRIENAIFLSIVHHMKRQL